MPPLAALTAVSCAVTAVAGRAALQPSSLLAGFAFGCHWSLMPVRAAVHAARCTTLEGVRFCTLHRSMGPSIARRHSCVAASHLGLPAESPFPGVFARFHACEQDGRCAFYGVPATNTEVPAGRPLGRLHEWQVGKHPAHTDAGPWV